MKKTLIHWVEAGAYHAKCGEKYLKYYCFSRGYFLQVTDTVKTTDAQEVCPKCLDIAIEEARKEIE